MIFFLFIRSSLKITSPLSLVYIKKENLKGNPKHRNGIIHLKTPEFGKNQISIVPHWLNRLHLIFLFLFI